MKKAEVIKLKVYGVNGRSRIVSAYSQSDISKYAKCYQRWEYL